MADERITVEVLAKDMASGVFKTIAGALGNVAQIAGGILSARVFERIGDAIMSTVTAAAEAYEWYDRVRFSLVNLALADEMATGNIIGMAEMMRNASARGAELLDWVTKLALASPFSMEDVNKMFRLTRAYGFQAEEAKHLTEVVIDYAAATGFGAQVLERLGLALGQVRQRGRLAGEEIRQLINTGIPVRDILAKSFNVTTAEMEKMIRKGLIPGARAVEDILKWMERFAGAGERAVESWFGMVVNLKDVKDLNMIAVFDGIAKALLPAMQQVFDLLSSDAFLKNMSTFGQLVGGWIANLVPQFQTFLIHLQGLVTAMASGDTDNIRVALSNLTGIDFVTIGTGIDQIATAIGNFQTNMTNLGLTPDAISGTILKIGEVVGAVSLIAMDGIAVFLERVSVHMGTLKNIGYPVFIDGWNQTMREMFMIWGSGGAENAAGIADFLLRLSMNNIAIGIGFLATMFGTLVDVIHGAPTQDILDRWQAYFDMAMNSTAWTMTGQGPTAPPPNPNAPGNQEPMWATPPPTGLPKDLWPSAFPTPEEKAKFAAAYSDVGKAAIRGLEQGWRSEFSRVEDIMQSDLLNLRKLAEELYDIQSPSKVFAEIGRQMAAGMGAGFHQEIAGGRMGYRTDMQVAGAKSVYMGGVNISDKYDLQSFTRALYDVLGG